MTLVGCGSFFVRASQVRPAKSESGGDGTTWWSASQLRLQLERVAAAAAGAACGGGGGCGGCGGG